MSESERKEKDYSVGTRPPGNWAGNSPKESRPPEQKATIAPKTPGFPLFIPESPGSRHSPDSTHVRIGDGESKKGL
ncbi:hypothetical protein O1611_g515 [Lasiodiplodia mahajangana]|uniref:Uncharacterized protein n=1 Tax=Lasiodiplodia mahajangana TaxID=1108764 RepID=A0ACC2K0Q2_9PEZI|nr:hypothetical protein O1611_g515 [Lasiodiplodia mahajangana]